MQLLREKIEEEGEEGLLYRAQIRYLPKGTQSEKPLMGDVIRQTNQRYFEKDTDELEADFLMISFPGMHCMYMTWLDPLLACAEDLGWTEAYKLITDHVRENLQITEKNIPDILEDYEKAKPNLILRPLFVDPDCVKLKGSLYWKIGDLALVLYMVIPTEIKDKLTTVRVTEEYFGDWRMDAETVLRDALENTQRKAPAVLCAGVKIPLAAESYSELFEELPEEGEEETEKDFVILTHKNRVNGAIALFYPGMMERMYRMLGGDYYVVFLSIHECALHKVKKAEKEHLRETLSEINQTFNENGDKLSETIYRYDGQLKKLVSDDEE